MIFFEPFLLPIPHPTSLQKDIMTSPTYLYGETSIPDVYDLASEARDRLTQLAASADHNLRLIVGHAQLVDTLTEELLRAKQQRMKEQRSFRKTPCAARTPLYSPPTISVTIVEIETKAHDTHDQLMAAPVRPNALTDGTKGGANIVTVHDENISDVHVSVVDIDDEGVDSDVEKKLDTPLSPACLLAQMHEHNKYIAGSRRESVDSDSDSGFESCESDSDDENQEDGMSNGFPIACVPEENPWFGRIDKQDTAIVEAVC